MPGPLCFALGRGSRKTSCSEMGWREGGDMGRLLFCQAFSSETTQAAHRPLWFRGRLCCLWCASLVQPQGHRVWKGEGGGAQEAEDECAARSPQPTFAFSTHGQRAQAALHCTSALGFFSRDQIRRTPSSWSMILLEEEERQKMKIRFHQRDHR